MNYYTSKEDAPENAKLGGEVWIRGPAVAIGYFKDEKKSKEDFDEEGWFHTGNFVPFFLNYCRRCRQME